MFGWKLVREADFNRLEANHQNGLDLLVEVGKQVEELKRHVRAEQRISYIATRDVAELKAAYAECNRKLVDANAKLARMTSGLRQNRSKAA